MTTTTRERIETITAPRTALRRAQADTPADTRLPTGLVLFVALTAFFFVLVAVSFAMAARIGA